MRQSFSATSHFRRPAAFFLPLLSLALAFKLGAATAIPPVDLYQVGEKARTDIVTPITLVVTESEAAEKRISEKPKQPVVYVYDASNATALAQAKLRATINAMHTEFIDKLEEASKYRQLTPLQAQHPGFTGLVTWFQNRHKNFPLTPELAEMWGTGVSDQLIQDGWSDAVAQTMTPQLVAVFPEPEVPIYLISAEDRKKLQWTNLTECLGSPIAPTSLRPVADAREELIRKLTPEATATGEFLARFVKENCAPDQTLSSLAAWNASPVSPTNESLAHWYAPGDRIVRRGQIIDARAKAALDLLRAKRDQESADATQQWSEGLRSFGRKAKTRFNEALAWGKFQWVRDPALCLIVAAGVTLLALAWLLLRGGKPSRKMQFQIAQKETAYTVVLHPHRNETVFLPLKEKPDPPLLTLPHSEFSSNRRPFDPDAHEEAPMLPDPAKAAPRVPASLYIDWESRVRATEERAEHLLDLVRNGLAPHLAREMMNDLVRRLIADRTGLMHAQQVARQEITALEERFAKIHASFQERLQQYQVRNAALEKQLAERTEQNRELIQTHIEALQKKVQ